ncbi:MAG: hypothetical protein U5J63_03075 [Fodinibius sp.]|nr:hypothetical protein [Fodinibius sp.]
MKIKQFLIGIVSCLYIVGTHTVKAQDTAEPDTSKKTLKQVLKDNRYPISFDKEGLSGEGGQWLRRQAREATIVSLGEMHLTQEIPAMMTALIKDLQRANEFDHLAIEVSPWTTEQMTKELQKGKAAYENFIKQYPFGVPFYNFENERDLLHQVVEENDNEDPLWGLDQIFAFSTNLALDRLEGLASTDSARDAIQKVRKAGKEKSADDPRLKKYSKGMVTPISAFAPVTFDTLRSYFTANEQAQTILEEVSQSITIYRTNDTDNYRSNQLRARYLRDNLRKHAHNVQHSNETPQIVIKMGGRHIYRGMTPNNVLDVGNLAVSLARSMGGEAFNVAILCGPNSNMTAFPTREAKCSAGYLDESLKTLIRNQAVLFDLSEVHHKLHDGAFDPNPKLKNFLWGYNAVVFIPNATPAEPIFTSGED